MAISGDTIVVGASFQGDLSGAAYVFVRDGTTWTQQAKLKASNPRINHNFGDAVAISGDTVVVGAQWSRDAYVFVRHGTNWSQQAHLQKNVTGFGLSAAISGDTAAIGSTSGFAYVYTGLGPIPPKLAIEQSGAGLRLSWPAFASDYALEQTRALAVPPAAITWSDIPGPYESDGSVNFITLPAPAGNTFWRLRKP